MRSNGELISVSQPHYCCKGGGRGGGGGGEVRGPTEDYEYYAGQLRPANMTREEKRAFNTSRTRYAREAGERVQKQDAELKAKTEASEKVYRERVSKVTDRQLDILEKAYDGGNAYSPAVSRIIFQVQPQRREQDRRDRNPIQRGLDIQSILSARGRMP